MSHISPLAYLKVVGVGRPLKYFFGSSRLYIGRLFVFFGSSVSSSVFFDRGSLATHKARHKAHQRHAQGRQQDTKGNACFFCYIHLGMKLKATKVITINIIQNNINNIFSLILFISLYSFLIKLVSKLIAI